MAQLVGLVEKWQFGPFWDKLEVTSAVLASATWPSVAQIKSTTYVEEVGLNLA